MNTPEFKSKEFQSLIDEITTNKASFRVVEEQYINSVVFTPQIKSNYTSNEWLSLDSIISIANEKHGIIPMLEDTDLNVGTSLVEAKSIIHYLKTNIKYLKINDVKYHDYKDEYSSINEPHRYVDDNIDLLLEEKVVYNDESYTEFSNKDEYNDFLKKKAIINNDINYENSIKNKLNAFSLLVKRIPLTL